MKKPPALSGRTDPVFDLLARSPHKNRLADYLTLLKPLDGQGRYLPFEELRYRWAPGLDAHSRPEWKALTTRSIRPVL